jgi:hypothetical protein
VVTGAGAGTTNINYTVTTAGCATTVSRSISVFASAPGTVGSFGNGLWNGYVYNDNTYTSYVGYYTTPAALSFNTTSLYANNVVPSTASTYQGCQVASLNAYGVRLQRTNFTAGTYQFGVTLNDDNMSIIINGATVYSSGYSAAVRANVYTCNLAPSDQVEIRYANTGGGAAELNFSLTLLASPAAPTPGSISGNQSLCSGATPVTTLGSVSAAVQGSCSIGATPYQWHALLRRNGCQLYHRRTSGVV